MNILVTGHLPKEIMNLLGKEHTVESNLKDRPMNRQNLLKKIKDKQGLLSMVTDKIDQEFFNQAPQLQMIANYAGGYDNIDLKGATERGIWVSNTPGILTEATADLTFALILSVARRVVAGDRIMRAGKYKYWAPMLFLGQEVSGKTLGILGMGRIGTAVAKRAHGFNMPVLYYCRRPIDGSVEVDLGLTYTPLEDLIRKADFLSLHVPFNESTYHIISERELSWMKPTAFLINASRGQVLDEKALVKALQEKRISGAGLDVYEKEPEMEPGLKELDNVVILPHLGSATLETRTKMARLAVENLLTGLRGQAPPNCLNMNARMNIKRVF